MKLRNKKTGIIEYLFFNSYPVTGDIVLEYYDENAESGYSEYCRYKTLAELSDEWEDYNPAEPLIKDEKIRKAVRAWAEVNSFKKVIYSERTDRSLCNLVDMGDDDYNIDFIGWIPTLKDGKSYTIAELCGEEEE